MKISSTILSGLLVAGSLLHAQEARVVDRPFLANLRAEAARNHPAAGSAKLLAAAAGQDILSVRKWDDPMIGVSVMAADKMMRMEDGDIRVGFEVPLPKPGLYQANLAKAEAMRRAGVENSASSTLEVGAAAAKAVIVLALTDESIALQSAQIQWLGSMAENARQMAINPDATSIDALRLDSEVAKETQMLDAARRTRDGLARSLNIQLGRKLESPWPILKLPADPSPVPVIGSEIARIPSANPKVRSMREMASAATAETEVAHRDRQPQFAVGVDADIYSGGDFRSANVGVKMSLPLFNRKSYDSKVEASKLREKAAARDIEAARIEVASAVSMTIAEAASNAAQARAYSGEIYQRSLQAKQTVEDSWISSKSTLTDLLDANRQLLSVRLEQRRLVAMQQTALEELNLLVPDRR